MAADKAAEARQALLECGHLRTITMMSRCSLMVIPWTDMTKPKHRGRVGGLAVCVKNNSLPRSI